MARSPIRNASSSSVRENKKSRAKAQRESLDGTASFQSWLRSCFAFTMRGLTLGLRSSSLPFTCNFRFSPPPSFTFCRRFHFLKPSSSLKQTKKKQQQQSLRPRSPPSSAPPPQSLRWLFNPKSSDDDNDDDAKTETDDDGGSDGDAALKGTILAGVLLIGTVGGFAGVGYVYRDQINTFLTQFSTLIEGSIFTPPIWFSYVPVHVQYIEWWVIDSML